MILQPTEPSPSRRRIGAFTRKALRNMIDFLVSAKGMTRDDAYMLVSVAGDVEITELVDRNKGVHVVLPKSVFKAP